MNSKEKGKLQFQRLLIFLAPTSKVGAVGLVIDVGWEPFRSHLAHIKCSRLT
jgi:hypothetical protein